MLSSSHDLVKSVVDPSSKMEAKIGRKCLGLISKLVHSSSHDLAKSVPTRGLRPDFSQKSQFSHLRANLDISGK